MLKPDTQKKMMHKQNTFEARVLTPQYGKIASTNGTTYFRFVYERQQCGCIHVTKATRGVINSEKRPRKEAQIRLLCVQHAPWIFT